MNPAVLGSTDTLPITFLASVLIWLMLAGIIFLWAYDGRIRKEQAIHAFISALFAWLISEMIKEIFPTPRPYQINGQLPLTLTATHSDGAFPSAHTAWAFAMAVTVWLHDKKLGLIFVISAFGVGMGRVLGNVHYMIDILGGVIIGGLTALVINRIHFFNLANNYRKKLVKR